MFLTEEKEKQQSFTVEHHKSLIVYSEPSFLSFMFITRYKESSIEMMELIFQVSTPEKKNIFMQQQHPSH